MDASEAPDEAAAADGLPARGRVLPIGGLKEKLLAALRGGVKTVLIPKDNEKDLAEIPDNVKQGLEIIPVETADEVLKLALTEPVQPVEWTEADEAALAAALAKRTKNPTAAPSTVTTTFMTRDGASWYVLARGFLPPPSREAFDQEWALHPDTYHSLKLYGRVVYETRWSQSWGKPYRYSGSIAAARDIAESTVLAGLLADVMVGFYPWKWVG